MTLARRAWHALIRDGWAVLQVVLVAVPASFALILALPGHTFSAALVAFAPMAKIGSETSWAIASGIVAVLSAWSWWATTRWMWGLSSILLAGWHLLVAICVFQASPLLPGAATYSWLAIAALFKIARPNHALASRGA